MLVLLAMIGGLLAASVGTASAAASVAVTPSTNLVNQQVINVSVTADVTAPGTMYAISTCGNADGNTPLTSITPADCFGSGADIGSGATTGYLAMVSDAAGGPNGGGFAAMDGGVTAGTVYSANILVQNHNIGVNTVTGNLNNPANTRRCVPVGTVLSGGTVTQPCSVWVALANSSHANFGNVYTTLTFRPAATVTISSVTGQIGNQAARAGNVVNVTGVNWDASLSLTSQLCADSAGVTCDASGLTGSASSDAGGVASGALTVDPSATTGARYVVLSGGGQTAAAPVYILGTRAISISPTAGGTGTSVTVTGSGFDASKSVTVASSNPAHQLLGPVVVTSSATGAVNAVIAITSDPTTNSVVALETGYPVPAVAPFVFSANSCDGSGCTVLQTVTLQVNPGALNITQADNAVTMDPITLNGHQQTSTGSVANITITDARGSLAGWSVTATMTDMVNSAAANHSIPQANMSLTSPTCAPASATDGSSTGLTVGSATQAFGASPVAVCTAAAGQGGGSYAITGGLSLIVPSTVASGPYTGTLTVLIV